MQNADEQPSNSDRLKLHGRPRLSIVAPCYNEAQGLSAFVERMTSAARSVVGDDYELILVNDGSQDSTWLVIRQLVKVFPTLVGCDLARNHGHQLAITAGLAISAGERVLIIDADLQDPPELLVTMMTSMDQGYDIVYGRRRRRQGESRFKLTTARLFYRGLSALTETPIPLDTGDFRLMSRRLVDRLNAMPECDRYVRGMVAWLGGRQTELLYDRDPRAAGETKYSLFKMLRLACDGITSFSMAPLHIASMVGLFGIMVALGLAAYTIVGFLAGYAIGGGTSLALVVVFFSTAQLLSLAIIGEYLGRTYMQSKARPLYLIEEIITDRTPPALPALQTLRRGSDD